MLDVFPDTLYTDVVLMVMPYLRPCNDPDFGNMGEFFDFVDQTLEVSHTEYYVHVCLLRTRA